MSKTPGSRTVGIGAVEHQYIEAGAASGFTASTGAMVTSRNDVAQQPQEDITNGVFLFEPREGKLLTISFAVLCDPTDNNTRTSNFSIRRWYQIHDAKNKPDAVQSPAVNFHWTCRELLQSATISLNPSTAPTSLAASTVPFGAWVARTSSSSAIKWASLSLGAGTDLGLQPNGVRFSAALIGECTIDPLGCQMIEVHCNKTAVAQIVGLTPVGTWVTD